MSTPTGKGGGSGHVQRWMRREHRSHLVYYLPIHDARTDDRLGVLADLSPEGLLLIGDRSYPAGTRLRLRIRGEAGSEIAGDVDITVTAESRWSAPDANPSYTATGMRFLEPDDATRSAIQDLRARLGLLGDEDADEDHARDR